MRKPINTPENKAWLKKLFRLVSLRGAILQKLEEAQRTLIAQEKREQEVTAAVDSLRQINAEIAAHERGV